MIQAFLPNFSPKLQHKIYFHVMTNAKIKSKLKIFIASFTLEKCSCLKIWLNVQQQHWLYLPPTTRTSFLFEWRAAVKDWIFGRAPLGNDWAYSLLSGSVTWGLAPGTWVQMVEGHIDLLCKTFAEIEWYSLNTYIMVLHLSAMQYTQEVVC